MATKLFRGAFAVFVRSQAIAAPVGLMLALLNYLSPTRGTMDFATAATFAWLVTTPVALLLSAAVS